LASTYTVGVAAVEVVVEVACMCRYELQNVVAVGPRVFRTVRARLIALQFTARLSKAFVGSGTGLPCANIASIAADARY
jgi:hypothetical protein